MPQVTRPTLDEVTAALLHLLPRGPIWPSVESPSGTMSDLIAALAEEPTRIFATGADALLEIWPGTAVWTIERWEALLGLSGDGLTLEQRQAQAAAFLVSQRGTSRSALIALMVELGYPEATITGGYDPAMVGLGVGWPAGVLEDAARFIGMYHYGPRYSITIEVVDNAVVAALDVPPPYEEVAASPPTVAVEGRKVTTSAAPAGDHHMVLMTPEEGVVGAGARAAVFLRNEAHAVTLGIAGSSDTIVVPVGLGWKRVQLEATLDLDVSLSLTFVHAGNGIFYTFGGWAMPVDAVLEGLIATSAHAHTYKLFRNLEDYFL